MKIMVDKIIKYPRTPHLSGSRLQKGDEDLSQIPFSHIKGKNIVVEEKVDGANVAVSFGEDGELLLQSRGHYLTGGYRERHYDLFKIWGAEHRNELYEILGTRYVLYGEWLYAKHKVYYDALPQYFLEFDILDKSTSKFLDTENRRKMLKGSSIESVPVLGQGRYATKEEILRLLGRSKYVSDSRIENLKREIARLGLDGEQILKETDLTDLAEGLYIKAEENGFVTERMKYVRYGFVQAVESVGDDWLKRKIVPNKLIED